MLRERVRYILNEERDLQLSIDTDTVDLDEYIDRALKDAVVMLANLGHRINPKSGMANEQGVFNIPDDFISVIAIRCNGWGRSIGKVAEIGSAEYNVAMNEFTAPKKNSPFAYYDGDTIICLPQGEGDVEYNAALGEEFYGDERAQMAVAYMAAALVAAVLEDDNSKTRFSNIVTELLK